MIFLLSCTVPPAPDSTEVRVVEDARTIGGCPNFPSDNVWNSRVDHLSAVADSTTRMDWLSDTFSEGLFPGACAGVWEGSRCGIPWNVVDENTPLQQVIFDGPWASGTDEFPIPAGYRVEGEPNPDGAWDRHVLLIDSSTCTLHELINVRNVLGTWLAKGGDEVGLDNFNVASKTDGGDGHTRRSLRAWCPGVGKSASCVPSPTAFVDPTPCPQFGPPHYCSDRDSERARPRMPGETDGIRIVREVVAAAAERRWRGWGLCWGLRSA